MRTRLGIFLKAPRPGRVKTRLGVRLGAEGAASLYGAFVVDVLTLAQSVSARQRILWWSGAPDLRFLRDLDARVAQDVRDWPAHPQVEGNLGARLAAAFAPGNPTPLLVLGTDSPDLPATALQRALDALEHGADAVFGAAHDGGVWCIGLREAPEGFFDALPWSTSNTGAALRERARGCGLVTVEAEPWYDCDTPDDLDALATRLRTGVSRATMTALWLRQNPGKAKTSDPRVHDEA